MMQKDSSQEPILFNSLSHILADGNMKITAVTYYTAASASAGGSASDEYTSLLRFRRSSLSMGMFIQSSPISWAVSRHG